MEVRIHSDCAEKLTTCLAGESLIWGLTHKRMRTGGEEQQRQQMVELQKLQSMLHSLFLRTRSSAASSSIQFEQE